MLLAGSLLAVMLTGAGVEGQETEITGGFQKEADPSLNCPQQYRAKKGDKVKVYHSKTLNLFIKNSVNICYFSIVFC